jgi:RNA polymerase sigma-70 factor (ECF subfamily)
MDLDDRSKAALFERIVTPHVPAAWNLARWLVRDPHDAEDVLQDAYLRAYRFLDQYRGGEAKSWLLSIVRNLCHDMIRRKRQHRTSITGDNAFDDVESDAPPPLERLAQGDESQQLRRAIEALPVEYREAIVLREFEGLSYKEIAQVADVPMGTVMSRLARAREKLVEILTPTADRQEGQA